MSVLPAERGDGLSGRAEAPFVPFDRRQYVARPEEILIRQKIIECQRYKTIYRPVIEFYSPVPGIGKTWLLRFLEAEYALPGESNLPRTHRPSITAFVDLGTVGQKRSVLRELTRQINSSVPEEEKIQDPAAADEEDESSLAKNFVAQVSDLSRRHTPVLLFDNLTSIDEESASWLEESIVDPLARTGRVLFVFSGGRSVRWKKFDVRKQVEPVELSAFGRGQTRDLLTKSYGDISEHETDVVFHFTAGLPSAIAEVLRLLRENNGQVDGKFAGSVYETIVEKQLLKEVPGSLKPFFPVIASSRKFGPDLSRHFPAEFPGPEYREKADYSYNDVLIDMQETGLVRWSSAEGGYCLHPVVRRIMDRNLAVRDPRQFWEYHNKAFELYQDWIRKYPRDGIGFLLELMYHQAQILKVQGQSPDDLVGLFAKNLDFLKTNDDTQWDLPDMAENLSQRLGADAESAEILGPALWGQIQITANNGISSKPPLPDN